ncbi:MAG: shikimate dehydrogenase [Actinobacteria bacterium]|nr:shikimate dehydrogenase [Actinomycetota bacterium]
MIGDPIRHSLSPILYNAAFRELDLDWAFLAFEVVTGEGAAAVDSARVLGLDGLAVTMPHKAAVVPALDRLSPTAAALGAVNVVYRQGSELVGESTDGAGFLDALRGDEGFDPTGRTFAVVGAGGAARAVVRAVAEAGASEVIVINRSLERATAAAALAGGLGRVGTEQDVSDVDAVVNATPLGMNHLAGLPVDPDLLKPGQLLVDLIYHPPITPLLAEARARGVTAVNGLGMLIHQAARAFRLWTGSEAPLDTMSAAAIAALAHERR